MESLQKIKDEIKCKTTAEQRKVEGIWGVDCLYNPAGNGRVFNYKFILTQTYGLGCAYSLRTEYPVAELQACVGCDLFELDTEDIALEVSLLDSVYPACAAMPPAYTETMDGVSVKKMRWRSEIILREAERLLGTVKGKNIVNVGVVGDILSLFADNGSNITGTDFDTEIVGRKMFGRVDILDGKRTLDAVAASDLCVVTGMTIATRTIDAIIDCGKQHNTKIIVFAETGANLGGYYAANGVDAYLGEIFPFYIFNGASRIDVYRGR